MMSKSSSGFSSTPHLITGGAVDPKHNKPDLLIFGDFLGN
jgi:hypothetical protein